MAVFDKWLSHQSFALAFSPTVFHYFSNVILDLLFFLAFQEDFFRGVLSRRYFNIRMQIDDNLFAQIRDTQTWYRYNIIVPFKLLKWLRVHFSKTIFFCYKKCISLFFILDFWQFYVVIREFFRLWNSRRFYDFLSVI